MLFFVPHHSESGAIYQFDTRITKYYWVTLGHDI